MNENKQNPNTSPKESFQERQDNELAALMSIFSPLEVLDLRTKHNKWTPLNLKIHLRPQKGSQPSESYCKITLLVKCPKNYPKVLPKLQLENPKGLKDADVANLLIQLNKEAYALKGEVCIYDLCQHVEEFLHKHDKPPPKSFYEQMVDGKQMRHQIEQNTLKENEEKTKKALHDEVLKRQAQLKNDGRTRRSTLSEVSPLHRSNNNSVSEMRNYLNDCDDHRRSEAFYFPTSGRRIQLGSCLGHSQKGCINYSGIDLESGQLYYISEWEIKYSQIEAKNKSVEEVVESVEKQVANLTKLHHKHLITYECVSCTKKKDHLLIYLVQEFLLGISVFSISGGLGWCSEGASMVAKGVLEALIFLHNNGVSHKSLMDTTVFMDNLGTIKVTDFSVIPYLQEFVCEDHISTPDLLSLGLLIESLIPTPHIEMKDFINKCKSERTLSGSDLLDHPFLYPLLLAESHSNSPEKPANYPHERPQSNINVQFALAAPLISDHSRLQTEFETINFIGKGAYGDVLKVRNILDNRQYAIKRIPLSCRNKQLYRKMTREVELLSRLNHENVVRYYNSWIETVSMPNPVADVAESDYSDSVSASNIKTQSQNRLTTTNVSSSDDESSSSKWVNFNPKVNDDSSDGVVFVDSNGKPVSFKEEESSEEEEEDNGNQAAVERKRHVIQYMYIQMEFCEKSTMRTAIDGNLYQDKERLWKLFREIVEGLAHIHQQGMIHRDLKPVNIFLDSKDHVKIGDFGLATTSVLALQHQNDNNQNMKPQLNFGDSQTGQVGTALYTAPELSGNASKSTYNQKVDLYSLGVIFFEMCTPPLNTGMERVKTIAALRMPEVVLPEGMLLDESNKNEVELLRWLLDHSPSKRPTSEELLTSELLPAQKLEANELQEMLRHVLANPQSRSYKHLIARCLTQESDAVGELTYHTGMVPISPLFENVKNSIVKVLRRHGAIEISTPLLTPNTKLNSFDSSVKLMTHSGSVVILPHDLRLPFLRHVALHGITSLRRYSIGRVYREKKIFNFHPKQTFECAFDIITPHRGHFLVDAELLSVAHEIIKEFNALRQMKIYFRVNHTSLIRSIFLYYSVPKDKYKSILLLVESYIEDKISKLKLSSAIGVLLPGRHQTVAALVDVLVQVDIPLSHIYSSPLKAVFRKRGEAAGSAKTAIKELETVISLCQSMGVSTPISVCFGLSMGYDALRTGNVVWQIVGEFKTGKENPSAIIACGGRYDSILDDYQKSAQRAGMTIINREMYSAGFSLSVEKLVTALSQLNDINSQAVVDLVVFVTGSRPPLKEVTQFLKTSWAAGIKCIFIEAPTCDNEMAKELGANHIILLGEEGTQKVRSWQNGRFHEYLMSMPEIIEYVKKNLSLDLGNSDHCHLFRNNSVANASVSNKVSVFEAPSTLPSLLCIIVVNEKLNSGKKKRIENQVEQKLSDVLGKFTKKVNIVMFAVELSMTQIKALISCIDPNPKDQNSAESQDLMNALLEKYAKNKDYLLEVAEEVTEQISKNKSSDIVGIFSILDSYYRLIL